MFRLLKMEAKLVFAVVGFGLAVVTSAFRGATWLVRRFSRPRAPAQAPAPADTALATVPPLPAPPPPGATPAGVNVNVTVTNTLGGTPAPPTPVPTATLQETPAPRRVSPAQILAQPDHGIYMTTGSTFMVTHPHAQGLLEQLDKMLFVAAHRDGSPWTVPPAPDISTPLKGAAQITAVVNPDDGFDACTARPLPEADNAVWLARAGQDFERRVGS